MQRRASPLVGFRARVFLLVVAVAATTAVATAFLIVVLATSAATSPTAPLLTSEDLDRVTQKVTVHGMVHRNWDDTAGLVQELAAETGQRIRLQSADRTLGDSEPTAGDVPAQQTAVIETRPALRLEGIPQSQYPGAAVEALWAYRDNLRLAGCWQSRGATLNVTTTPLGIRLLSPTPQPADTCVAEALDGRVLADEVNGIAQLCATATDSGCVQNAFTQRFIALTPPPAVLLVGIAAEPAPPAGVELTPALIAAGVVALIVVAASLLISRRVLRPIRALATASQQLGRGDLSGRVPERGRDELTDLSRTFNRMAESLQRSKEQQHNLIADITHELRTPTTTIRGYLEALQDGVFPPDQELFRSLCEEAVLQERLINDLQDLALAEAGDLVYHHDVADLTDLLRAVRTAHSSAAAEREVSLELDAPAPVPAVVDADRLRQVITNLMTNALRATPAGGVITLRAYTAGGAVIEVSDTGCGIAGDDLEHVFDRFWRADGARGRHTGGRGLGLAIAREIIAAHHGTITVASTVGAGTTFTVKLPLEQPS
ncbi:sensor histidine kinase [Lentzea sp. NPDC051213]|uniref:sensor histidine kinase n=1 Tax=Lentzea sp. NPDC051213 TaxID=3364126 RepID=UPI0037A0CB43